MPEAPTQQSQPSTDAEVLARLRNLLATPIPTEGDALMRVAVKVAAWRPYVTRLLAKANADLDRASAEKQASGIKGMHIMAATADIRQHRDEVLGLHECLVQVVSLAQSLMRYGGSYAKTRGSMAQ